MYIIAIYKYTFYATDFNIIIYCPLFCQRIIHDIMLLYGCIWVYILTILTAQHTHHKYIFFILWWLLFLTCVQWLPSLLLISTFILRTNTYMTYWYYYAKCVYRYRKTSSVAHTRRTIYIRTSTIILLSRYDLTWIV